MSRFWRTERPVEGPANDHQGACLALWQAVDECAEGVTFRRKARNQPFTEVDPPVMVISEKDKETYAVQGFLILRQAFAKTRIEALLEGIERLIDKGLAGACELGWIDRERRLPGRTGHLLNPDKYHPAFADWIDEDLAPHLEALVCGPGVRHSLFGMLASGGGKPYTQQWHRDLCRPGEAEETAYLRRHEGRFVQFNAPLVAGDRFLPNRPRESPAGIDGCGDRSVPQRIGGDAERPRRRAGTGRHRLLQRQPLAPGLEPRGAQALDHALRLLERWSDGDAARVRTARAADPARAS